MTARRRRLRLAALGALAAAAGSSPWWGPPVLRQVPWFAATRVEVTGARLLAPHEALALSGIRIGDNVWTDPAAWEAALRAHPAVDAAAVERRLPGTLRIRLREKRPVALVRAGTLRPATAAGEILPVDPALAPLDLPVVATALADTATRASDDATAALLAAAGRLAELDPALAARVSELAPAEGGGVRLVLAGTRADVLLPEGAGEVHLVQLRAVLAELEHRLQGRDGRAEVDARFTGQVVLRPAAAARAPRSRPN